MRKCYREYAYTKMPIGKHRGVFLKDIPDSYLMWAAVNFSDRGLALMARTELHRRSIKVAKHRTEKA